MRRVLIVGSSGAGKTTLATQLAGPLGLPVIHLDAHFWQPGWAETPRDIWRARVKELLERDRWIMDGNYGSTLAERARAADTIILLAFSRVRCLYNVFKRAMRYRGRARPDLNPGCPEHLPDWDFIRWIWTYPDAELPTVLEVLAAHEKDKRIIVLRSRAEVERFLATVNARPISSQDPAAISATTRS